MDFGAILFSSDKLIHLHTFTHAATKQFSPPPQSYPRTKQSFEAILDTGATTCCIDEASVPAELMEENTFNVQFSGINSTTTARNQELAMVNSSNETTSFLSCSLNLRSQPPPDVAITPVAYPPAGESSRSQPQKPDFGSFGGKKPSERFFRRDTGNEWFLPLMLTFMLLPCNLNHWQDHRKIIARRSHKQFQFVISPSLKQ